MKIKKLLIRILKDFVNEYNKQETTVEEYVNKIMETDINTNEHNSIKQKPKLQPHFFKEGSSEETPLKEIFGEVIVDDSIPKDKIYIMPEKKFRKYLKKN